MSESEALTASQQKQFQLQQQQQQQQQQIGASTTASSMANMAWQYPQNNMHLYSHYAG